MAGVQLCLSMWSVRGVHNPVKRRKTLCFVEKNLYFGIALLQETCLDRSIRNCSMVR